MHSPIEDQGAMPTSPLEQHKSLSNDTPPVYVNRDPLLGELFDPSLVSLLGWDTSGLLSQTIRDKHLD